jgi:vitamin B12 transporter
MLTLTRTLLAPALSLVAVGTVLAAETDIEPINVTASRLVEPSAISLSVLDADRIERQHGRDVLDLLRTTAGISATQPGGPGGISEVFLRGAESNFTVVLIDGVRVNDPSNPRGGGYDFSTVAADDIERIEVARGALSAVHGSDAMAGVVNIITRRPTDEPSLSVRAEGGSDDFQRASLMLSGPLGGHARGSLKASHVDFGDMVAGSTQRIASAQADLELGAVDAGLGAIRTGVRHVERDRASFPDASGGPLFAVLRDHERAEASETSAWAQMTRALTEQWSVDATASFFSRREETLTPAVAPGVFDGVPATANDTRFERGQVTITHRYVASPSFAIGGGIDVQFEDGRRTGWTDLGFMTLPSNFDLDRVGRAAFIEARYLPIAGLELYGAARVDDTNTDRARGSGRAAVSYALAATGTRLHASWSNGHKQPSFYALGDTLVGNENLRVETSETFEVGIEQTLAKGRLVAALAAFRTRYEDLIDFDFDTFRLVNRSQARIDGVEVSLTAQLTNTLTARAHATLSDIELDAADATLLYRPERFGGIELGWHPGDAWSLHAHAQVVGKRAGSSVPTGQITLPSYERVDIAVSRSLTEQVRLFAALDNVFDEDYQEAVGFPDAGRRVRIGAQLRF